MIVDNGNAAVYFVDRHLNEGRADKVAFQEVGGEDHGSITYAQLSEQSGRLASALHSHGINREERVAMLVLDQIEFPQIFWGCLKAGVVPIPLNTLLASDNYDAILKDSRACCLFVSSELLSVVEPALNGNPYLRHVVVIDGEFQVSTPDFTVHSYDNFTQDVESMPAVQLSEDECSFWLYSSGSTGAPKGVRHVHSSLQATAESFGQKILDIQETDVVYSVAKMFFAYGLGNAMSFPLSVGATTLLYKGRPTPDSVSSILIENQPSLFCGVPTLYAAMLEKLENTSETSKFGIFKQVEKPSFAIRLCTSAGEALPEDVGQRWKKLTGIDIIDGVGSTEMLHIFLSNKPGDIVYGTSGKAVPGYEVRLVNEEGGDVADEEVGELLVKGASAAEGYWNQRDKSRSTFEGEWTRTGDKYQRTKDGRYIYCGRTDDMFKVSGIWVSPFEIEQALFAHPDVLEAAVVPGKDADGLEKPKAFIVLKSGVVLTNPAAELKDFVKEKIGKWKYPRWIEIVEELPKTATGKIQRYKLREGT